MTSNNINIVEIYDLYSDPIYRFIYFRVGDKDTAWDLTQECFLKMLEYSKNNKIQNPRALLYRIAKNLIFDLIQKTKKYRIDPLEELQNILKSEENIEEELDKKQELHRVLEELKKIPKEHKDLIIMRFIDEFSFSEISDISGKNQIALRVQTSRIIKNLKIKLNDRS